MSLPAVNDIRAIFTQVGKLFDSFIKGTNEQQNGFNELLTKAEQTNRWFTRGDILHAFSAWAGLLNDDTISEWLKPYQANLLKNRPPKTVGIINAGNIPLVGFHDFLSVLVTGNTYLGKNSSDDPYLLPFVAEKLVELMPELRNRISFVEKLSGFDAVIATGSDNSARYFDYYFGKYPHVIRKNRNGVAVLTGGENANDFKNLGEDMFRYFGLGCRNVSKLYVPRDYKFDHLFESIQSFSPLMQHSRYMDNHDYNNAIYLLKKIQFLDNGFVLLKEDDGIASPIAVIYYEYYPDRNAVLEKLAQHKEKIQCVVGDGFIPFGKAQEPALWDYADGVDTVKFLLEEIN